MTARPDDTVAPAAKAGSPNSLPVMAGNVMVWLIFPATIVWVIGAAAAKVVFPLWLALITHVPDCLNVTVPLANSHTVGLPELIANDTLKPDVAVAVGV